MKRITRLVGIAVLAALPAVAHAQTTTPKPWSVGVSGGASIPMGDLGDVVDMGFIVGGHVMLSPASLTHLAFRGDVTYDRWAYKALAGTTFDGNLSTLGVTANAIFKSSSAMTIKPYAIGGVGLFSSKASTSSTVVSGSASSERANNVGIQLGGGLEFQLSGFTTFLEAKFVNSFTEGSSSTWVPITFGIRF